MKETFNVFPLSPQAAEAGVKVIEEYAEFVSGVRTDTPKRDEAFDILRDLHESIEILPEEDDRLLQEYPEIPFFATGSLAMFLVLRTQAGIRDVALAALTNEDIDLFVRDQEQGAFDPLSELTGILRDKGIERILRDCNRISYTACFSDLEHEALVFGVHNMYRVYKSAAENEKIQKMLYG